MKNDGLQLKRRGLMLVLSSPSGAGKTSLSRKLLSLNLDLSLSVSMTTRSPRPGELEGEDYFFVSQQVFKQAVQDHAFLEYAQVFGNAYGTPKAQVDAFLEQGKDVLFDIDWQGAQQLFRTAAADVVRIFILPPSLEILEKRLHQRSQDAPGVVAARMAKATDEISHWAEYDYVLVNDQFDTTLAQLQAILQAERLKRERQPGLSRLVQALLKASLA
jgi:guanylate kinase